MIGNKIYIVAGATPHGATSAVWMLDLDAADDAESWAWQPLPEIPGPPRILPVVAAQRQGTTTGLFVFSGRVPDSSDRSAVLTDAYVFHPGRSTWTRLRDVGLEKSRGEPRSVMAGSAVAFGKDRILVFGGARGDVYLRILRLESKLAAQQAAGLIKQAAATTVELNRIRGHQHQGFSRNVLVYHTATDSWAKAKNEIPPAVEDINGKRQLKGGPVTAAAVRWRDDIVLVSGEIRPGVRTPQLLLVRPDSKKAF
jgi:N-acetylneuraminic acid mutarotase